MLTLLFVWHLINFTFLELNNIFLCFRYFRYLFIFLLIFIFFNFCLEELHEWLDINLKPEKFNIHFFPLFLIILFHSYVVVYNFICVCERTFLCFHFKSLHFSGIFFKMLPPNRPLPSALFYFIYFLSLFFFSSTPNYLQSSRYVN